MAFLTIIITMVILCLNPFSWVYYKVLGDQKVTTRAKKSTKNTLFTRVLSIFLAFLIVGGSLAALIELF